MDQDRTFWIGLDPGCTLLRFRFQTRCASINQGYLAGSEIVVRYVEDIVLGELDFGALDL